MAEARRTLIKGATLVTMDDDVGDHDRADILVVGNEIAQIAPSIEADADETIDAAGKIAIPGLIDSHNHLWETPLRGLASLWNPSYHAQVLPRRWFYRPEDMYNAGHAAGFEALSYGTTTIVDYCHNIGKPGQAAAAIDGLSSTGIRSAFAFSLRIYPGEDFKSRPEKFAEAEKVHKDYHRPGALTSLMMAVNEPFAAPMDTIAEDVSFTRSLGVPITFHSIFSSHITGLNKAGLLGKDILAVHCNVLTDDELDMMAETGAALCFTPSVDVYGTPADVVGRARKRGVGVTFGCDVPPIVASDLLAQLRLMFQIQGYMDGVVERMEGRAINGRRPPARRGLPSLSARDTLKIATIETARILGMDEWIGSLTPGKRADIVLIDRGPFGSGLGDPSAYVLLQTGAREVDMVMVDGRIRKKAGALVDFDAADVAAKLKSTRDHVLGQQINPSNAYEVSGGGEFFDR